MSYRKKVKRRINKKKVTFRFFPFITILLVISFIFIYRDGNVDIYEQKISHMKQMNEKLSSTDYEGSKVYYVSADGKSTDGTDINNPMSLEEANKKTYYGNQKVLFKRGDIFYGTVSFKVEATEDEMFYIGTYGEGEKPIISGANILINTNAWELDSEGIYKLDLSNESNFEGIGILGSQSYNIGFITDENENIYPNRKKTKEKLQNENDFYCEDTYLYIKSDSNPSDKFGKIKLVAKNDLLKISSNTILDGLNLQYTGGHGISKKESNLKNIYIHNCVIKNIGGSVLIPSTFTRYGNGIEFYECNAENILISNNILANIYDAAFTMQGGTGKWSNVDVNNNIFIANSQNSEIWNRENGDGIENYIFSDNIQINTGKGWGYDARPDKNVSADYIIYEYTKSLDAKMFDNKSFNPQRLYFIYYTNYKLFTSSVESNNNSYYISSDAKIINEEADITALKKYDKDQNSTFRLLSDTEINQISNPEILNSNNYEEIKQYYENLEKEFKYTDIKNEILNKYKEFSTTNKDILTLISGAENKITSIQSSIEATTKDNITQAKLQEIINNTYSIGTDIVTAFTKNAISKQELIQLIKQINDLGQALDKIYNECGIENTSNKEEIISNIKTLEENFNNNLDLDIIELQDLIYIGKDIQDKEKTTYADYIYCTSLKRWLDDILKIYIDKYITDNPVSIKYTTTELTNQNVTATIETNAKIEITNNSNSKEHVFSENGEFIFEYKIKGRSFTIKATVNNIDKDLPVITGIENGQTYSSNVKFGVTEKNPDKVEISLNGTKIENYKVGQSLTEEGIYKLKVSDKAGNVAEMVFYILYIDEDDYMFEDDKIVNIMYNTKLSSFGENFPLDMDYVIKRNDQELSENDLVATGDILELKTGEKYTLIVKGDLNSDGIVNVTDLVRTQNYILKRRTLTEIEELAADANRDKQPITIMDLVRIQILILNPPEM